VERWTAQRSRGGPQAVNANGECLPTATRNRNVWAGRGYFAATLEIYISRRGYRRVLSQDCGTTSYQLFGSPGQHMWGMPSRQASTEAMETLRFCSDVQNQNTEALQTQFVDK
jgi:hypothetical protein